MAEQILDLNLGSASTEVTVHERGVHRAGWMLGLPTCQIACGRRRAGAEATAVHVVERGETLGRSHATNWADRRGGRRSGSRTGGPWPSAGARRPDLIMPGCMLDIPVSGSGRRDCPSVVHAAARSRCGPPSSGPPTRTSPPRHRYSRPAPRPADGTTCTAKMVPAGRCHDPSSIRAPAGRTGDGGGDGGRRMMDGRRMFGLEDGAMLPSGVSRCSRCTDFGDSARPARARVSPYRRAVLSRPTGPAHDRR